MATSKQQAAAPADETVKKPEYDPNERVEVYIPRGEKNGDPNFFISINQYSALLPRGQKSLVPRYVAEEIEREQMAHNALLDYAETREIKE